MLQTMPEVDVAPLPMTFAESQFLLSDATDPSLFDLDQFHLVVTSPPYNVGLSYDNFDDSNDYDS